MTWAYLPPRRCSGWRAWLFRRFKVRGPARGLRICGFTFWWREVR